MTRLIPILLLFIMVAFAFPMYAQLNEHTTKPDSTKIGGELKGLYIAGATSIVGGATIGILSNSIDDHPRDGLPIISAGIGLAPTSLVGLGLGSLFAKNHSSFTDHFKLGLGLSYSSPVFSEFVPGNSHRTGINLRLISKEIGPWRYQIGFSKYASEEYEFERIEAYRGETNLSWWELNLNLQYVFDASDKIKVYPFIGTQYNSINSNGRNLNNEILTNYGLGLEYEIFNQWNIYTEAKYTIDPDNNPGNFIYSFGVIYALK